MYFPDIVQEQVGKLPLLVLRRLIGAVSWTHDATSLQEYDRGLVANLTGILGSPDFEPEALDGKRPPRDLLLHHVWSLLRGQTQTIINGCHGRMLEQHVEVAALAVRLVGGASRATFAESWRDAGDVRSGALLLGEQSEIGEGAFDSGDAHRLAALRIVGDQRLSDHKPAVVANTNGDDPAVRYYAIRAALLLGEPAAAFEPAERIAAGDGYGWQYARLFGALLDVDAIPPLAATLAKSEEMRPHAARLAGYSGLTSMMPGLLKMLDEPAAVPYAAEAISLITGVDYVRDALTASPPPDAPIIDAEAEGLTLPYPDADALKTWWEDNRSKINSDQPLLLGLPRTADRLQELISQGNQHVRAFAALLAARDGDQPVSDTQSVRATLPPSITAAPR